MPDRPALLTPEAVAAIRAYAEENMLMCQDGILRRTVTAPMFGTSPAFVRDSGTVRRVSEAVKTAGGGKLNPRR